MYISLSTIKMTYSLGTEMAHLSLHGQEQNKVSRRKKIDYHTRVSSYVNF